MVHKIGKNHWNADAWSRVPIPSKEEEWVDPEDGGRVMMLGHLEASLITDRQVERWTSRGPVLARVSQYVGGGWPKEVVSPCFSPCYHRRDKLSI